MDDLESAIMRLELIEAAERLKHDYAFDTDIDVCRDDPGRFERFADLFTAGGSWDDGDGEGPLQGREAMVLKLASLKDAWHLANGLHLVCNPCFTIDGDEIAARWHTICALQYEGGTTPAFVGGFYEERYAREGGRLRVRQNVTMPAFPETIAQAAVQQD